MKVKPMDDRVLVSFVAEETKTASGIIIPDSQQKKNQLWVMLLLLEQMKN